MKKGKITLDEYQAATQRLQDRNALLEKFYDDVKKLVADGKSIGYSSVGFHVEGLIKKIEK